VQLWYLENQNSRMQSLLEMASGAPVRTIQTPYFRLCRLLPLEDFCSRISYDSQLTDVIENSHDLRSVHVIHTRDVQPSIDFPHTAYSEACRRK
jgi:hypothetical protein